MSTILPSYISIYLKDWFWLVFIKFFLKAGDTMETVRRKQGHK